MPEESSVVEDHTSVKQPKLKSNDNSHLTRGKKLVEMSKKRKANQQHKELVPTKIPKRPSKQTNAKSALETLTTKWLFLVMINDLTTSNTLSSIWKFADDTTVSEIVPKFGASVLQDTVYMISFDGLTTIDSN